MKHTPGPWTAVEKLSGSENHKGWTLSALIPDEAGVETEWCWIADISPVIKTGGDPSEEGRANARLIAAAPDLLNACRKLVSAYEAMPDGQLGRGLTNGDFLAARDAIAKAEGRQ